jgi:hypothetical protein
MRTRLALARALRRVLLAASALAAVALGPAVAGCATYHDQLARSQQAFEQSQDERALGLLRDLEVDATRLPISERAHYAYLRGMSDYRLGYRGDARHWLSLARAYDEATPGVLPTDWKSRAAAALEAMNEVVQTEGYRALVADTKPGEDAVDGEPASAGAGAGGPSGSAKAKAKKKP